MSVESGIAEVLRGLGDLRVSEGWPDTVNTDAAIVEGPLSDAEQDMAGCRVAQLWEITLLFSVAMGVHRARERVMPYFLPKGPKSIREALYANPTLGGEVEAFLWRGITSPPGLIRLPGKGLQAEIMVEEYYGGSFQLEGYV